MTLWLWLRVAVYLRRAVKALERQAEAQERIAAILDREAPDEVASEEPDAKPAHVVEVHTPSVEEMNEAWRERHPY